MLTWLDYLSSLSVLAPAILSVYHYKQLTFELKLLSFLFLFATVVELTNFISIIESINNVWLINIYSLIESAILCFVLTLWFNAKKSNVFFVIIFSLYVVYWIYTTFYSGNLFEFNSDEKAFKGLFLMFLAGCVLLRFSKQSGMLLYHDFRFWISAAILIYFSITLIIFSTATFLLNGNHQAMEYSWQLHSAINIISNFLFAYGYLWFYRRNNIST